MHSLRNTAVSFLALSAILLDISGCGRKSDAPPQKTAEEVQAEKLAEEQRRREYEQKTAQLEAELKKATPAQVRSILQSCKSAVLELAKSQNRSPFDVFLVDEYSADVYQASAYVGGGDVSSAEQRAQQFLKARKAGEKDLRYSLSLSYTVVFTYDSFSGPKKEPKRFMCELEPGLSVRAH